MITFYDIMFIRIYQLYIKYGEKDIPVYMSLLLLSLFETFNIFSILFIFIGILNNGFTFSKFWIISICCSVMIFNSLRIYKVIGVGNLLRKYSAPRIRSSIHPFYYFAASLTILLILRLLGIFPYR